MDRYRSILLSLNLMLMQVISPWVHAHVGQETGGFLHLPGLERIKAVDTETALPELAAIDADVIVVMQTGMEPVGSPLSDGAHADPAGLAAIVRLAPPSPSPVRERSRTDMIGTALPLSLWRSGAPPRASPG